MGSAHECGVLIIEMLSYLSAVRFFRIIFAFYFFSLAIIPCCDAARGSANENVYVQSNDTAADQHTGEACSPLCTCNCCGSVTLISVLVNTYFFSPAPFLQYLYAEQTLVSPYFSIWQPPKI